MENLVFLGVVERNRSIHIPWRGTNIYPEHNFEIGQNLLVTLEVNNAGIAKVIKVELPTLLQLKQMKEELLTDWARFDLIFKQAPMARKVKMLYALDRA